MPTTEPQNEATEATDTFMAYDYAPGGAVLRVKIEGETESVVSRGTIISSGPDDGDLDDSELRNDQATVTLNRPNYYEVEIRVRFNSPEEKGVTVHTRVTYEESGETKVHGMPYFWKFSGKNSDSVTEKKKKICGVQISTEQI